MLNSNSALYSVIWLAFISAHTYTSLRMQLIYTGYIHTYTQYIHTYVLSILQFTASGLP